MAETFDETFSLPSDFDRRIYFRPGCDLFLMKVVRDLCQNQMQTFFSSLVEGWIRLFNLFPMKHLRAGGLNVKVPWESVATHRQPVC